MKACKSSVFPSWQSKLQNTKLLPWLCLNRWCEDDKETKVSCLSCCYLLRIDTCKQVIFVFSKWCKSAHICFGGCVPETPQNSICKNSKSKSNMTNLYSWSLQCNIPWECHFQGLQLQECHLIKYSRLQSRIKFHIQIVIPGPKYVGS